MEAERPFQRDRHGGHRQDALQAIGSHTILTDSHVVALWGVGVRTGRVVGVKLQHDPTITQRHDSSDVGNVGNVGSERWPAHEKPQEDRNKRQMPQWILDAESRESHRRCKTKPLLVRTELIS